MALHKEAQQLLAAKLARQQAEGQLQELPELNEGDKARIERLPKRSLQDGGALLCLHQALVAAVAQHVQTLQCGTRPR